MEEQILLKKILANALKGINAHINPKNALEDLSIDIAGKNIPGSPHTIWQILKHINYWQEKFLSYIKDESTPIALTAKEGWSFPQSPVNENELKQEVQKFCKSLEEAISFDKDRLNKKAQRYKSGFDVLQAMASHISYHIGEIVMLRRILKSWPPPSGGDTW
jgi:uncharacterized damage-inducible protein DinB